MIFFRLAQDSSESADTSGSSTAGVYGRRKLTIAKSTPAAPNLAAAAAVFTGSPANDTWLASRIAAWVTPDVRAMLVQHLARPDELLRRLAVEIPVLSEAGRRAERAFLAVAANPDRQGRLPHRLRIAPGVGQRVIAALEGGGLLWREEASEDLARLLEPVTALAGRAKLDAVGARFLLVPAGSDAEFAAVRRTSTSSVAAMLARTAGCR